MHNSIVIYTIKSENPEYRDMNVEYATALHLRNMGIIRPCNDENQVIRQGDVTVTVYVYRKA